MGRLTAVVITGLTVSVMACSTSTGSSANGSASVQGTVMFRSGAPAPQTRVDIRCGSSVTSTATTDASGNYLTSLLAPGSVGAVDQGLSCQFTTSVPATLTIDTIVAVTFYPFGEPHPLQIVNLHG